MWVFEVGMERSRNEMVGEMGDPRENPPTNGIVQQDSHLRKSGEQANRSATMAPRQSRRIQIHIPLTGLKPEKVGEVTKDGASCSRKLDWRRNEKESAMAFVKDSSYHLTGVISENHGKPKSRWPDTESNPAPPKLRVQTGLLATSQQPTPIRHVYGSLMPVAGPQNNDPSLVLPCATPCFTFHGHKWPSEDSMKVLPFP
ncbi:hypothetical protein PR048_001095 [Dryococelus australis]|uniref:Uncharacterized protein n=1 Tax=Dryococelus australis TaxID=614101 RepID=A0ABQ9IGF8_9NEOP|nr:hypothetical protein PR048_001095 [Dryococelus australis]